MRAEARTIRLSTGHELRTPLLVPSISSAGFRRVNLDNGESEPEPSAWLRVIHVFINDALLISAYDAAHGNLPEPEDLAGNFTNGMYAKPATLFLDSGLYEQAYGPAPFEGGPRLPWSERAHGAWLDQLAVAANIVLVNYDSYDEHGDAPYLHQIQRGHEFFTTRHGFVSDMLIKPERRGGKLDTRELTTRLLESLAPFDIIGVTEKELGDSVLERLCNLATLRGALTGAGISAPIHLFGSLDPLMTPLYHAAGAEIFDGLSWLRYGYDNGLAIYRDELPVLDAAHDLHQPARIRSLAIVLRNLHTLGSLGETMRRYASTGDWQLFGDTIGGRLHAAHNAFTTSMGD
jgi:hypothetical protein